MYQEPLKYIPEELNITNGHLFSHKYNQIFCYVKDNGQTEWIFTKAGNSSDIKDYKTIQYLISNNATEGILINLDDNIFYEPWKRTWRTKW